MIRRGVLSCLLGMAALHGGSAAAYPQYIGKGYTNCATCHYSPSGGGLLNAYGHASSETLLTEVAPSQPVVALRQALAKNEVTGYDASGDAALQWDVGLDTRVLLLRAPRQENGEPEWMVIPMLVEAGGVVLRGPLLLYGTLTSRRVLDGREDYVAFSREHWLRLNLGESSTLRAGRLVMPFGLRIPDHTQYTREDLGFDKFDQAYGVEFDWFPEEWLLSLALSAGDLVLDPKRLQERAGYLSLSRNIAGRAAFGGSLGVGFNKLTEFAKAALFVRLRVWQRAYLMGEVSGVERWSRRIVDKQRQGAALLRLGWLVMESFDLYYELGVRGIEAESELRKLRQGIGVNWQVLPWVELSPTLVAEQQGRQLPDVQALLQLHLIY